MCVLMCMYVSLQPVDNGAGFINRHFRTRLCATLCLPVCVLQCVAMCCIVLQCVTV